LSAIVPTASICIATYKRPEGLGRLLESLEAMKCPDGVSIEVLVVDNDAEASAAAIARDHASALAPLHYLVEPRQNIAHARNRALERARGEWLLFVDDDEFVDEGWLAAYLEFVERRQCDGAFGPVLPRLEIEVTPWLDAEGFFSRPRHANGAAMPADELRTSNAIVRRSCFGSQLFDPAFGRSGGSDSALFGRMYAKGAHFEWCDAARVTESVPPERHRPGWLVQRAFRGGCVHGRLTGADGVWPRVRALTLLALFVVATPLALLRGRPAALRVVLRACTQAGRLWSALGRSYEEYRDPDARRAIA
jgi:succinoglycan biosynthesis protein ExoM